jgi:hypothetical protein
MGARAMIEYEQVAGHFDEIAGALTIGGRRWCACAEQGYAHE